MYKHVHSTDIHGNKHPVCFKKNFPVIVYFKCGKYVLMIQYCTETQPLCTGSHLVIKSQNAISFHTDN